MSIERQPEVGKETPLGTGFIVSSQRNHLLLVTAKHVLFGSDGKVLSDLAYRINLSSGPSRILTDREIAAAGGGAWFSSQNDDLAVRFLPVIPGASTKAIGLDRFLAEEQVEVGTPIAVLGFPMGLRSTDHARPIARKGMIARADAPVLIADVFVFPGNSGGPALYVPAFKTGAVSFRQDAVTSREMLVGVVLSFIQYTDVAVSAQTNRLRVTFEENSGLAYLVPAWAVKNLITSPAVVAFDEKLAEDD